MMQNRSLKRRQELHTSHSYWLLDWVAKLVTSMTSLRSMMDGYSSEILQEKLNFMQLKAVAIPAFDQMKINFESDIALIEISSIVIHTIYIQRFLNKNAKLVVGLEERK